MILDSSALVSLVLEETGYEKLVDVMLDASTLHVSTATWVEIGVVSDRRLSDANRRKLEKVCDALPLTLVPFSVEQARIARDANRRYGPRSGSAARLNMGDCFSYALAKDLDEPLLFVGDDFTYTDVQRVDLG